MAIELEALDRKAAADDEVNWVTAIFMGLFHVGAIAALFFFTWKALLVSMFLWWVSGSLGIGMGYHRLLTHRGYKTPKWVEYFLTVCATLALEGGPIFWVATHRIHHQHSDQEGDPHSPRRRQVVGAHGLDSDRQVDASRHHDARPLRSRSGQRSSFMSGSPSITMSR